MALGGNVSCDTDQEQAFTTRSCHGFVEEPLLMDCVKDNNVLENEEESLELSYGCPYPGCECSITRNIPQLVAHLKDDHNVDMQYGSTFNHRYVISNPHEMKKTTWMLTVFNCFGLQFCLYLEAIPTGITPCYKLSLRFMGEKSKGKKYVCCLKFGGNGRELTWEGVPRSICDNLSHLKETDDTDGLVIPRNLALLCSCGNEQKLRLRVTGYIWKEY